jgi:hypothetical protein
MGLKLYSLQGTDIPHLQIRSAHALRHEQSYVSVSAYKLSVFEAEK